MPPKLWALDEALNLLQSTPQRIAEITSDLSRNEFDTPEARGKWSANEVLAHLRACADVWGACIERIVAEDVPMIRALSPRSWIKKTNHLEQKFPASLGAFKRQRIKLLATL